MHNFMDSKLMAKLLRQALAERNVDISHSDSLELVARQFGLANWNILSARIAAAGDSRLALPKGWIKTGKSPRLYLGGLDPDTGDALIESLPGLVSQDNDDFCTLMQSVQAGLYRGRHIRLTGEIRTQDVVGGGTIWLRIDGQPGRSLRFDNLETREPGSGMLRGTTGWTSREIVFDVPAEADSIHFGFFLAGTGRCWARRFVLETVAETVPLSTVQGGLLPAPVNLDFRDGLN